MLNKIHSRLVASTELVLTLGLFLTLGMAVYAADMVPGMKSKKVVSYSVLDGSKEAKDSSRGGTMLDPDPLPGSLGRTCYQSCVAACGGAGNPACAATCSTRCSSTSSPTDCTRFPYICTADQFCGSKSVCRTRIPTAGVTAQFMQCPSSEDIAAFDRDFTIRFLDRDRLTDPGYIAAYPTTHWDRYPYSCDIRSTQPQRYLVYNMLRFLRDIRFSQPLPFTRSSIYEYVSRRAEYHPSIPAAVMATPIEITPSLECNHAPSTGGPVVFPGITRLTVALDTTIASYNFQPDFATCRYNPETAPSVQANTINGFVFHPIDRVSTFIHEIHHALAQSVHTDDGGNADATIDEMGSYAVEFYFNAWVVLYGTNVDEYTQLRARGRAQLALSRITRNKCPSDASLRLVVNAIQPGTCRS